MAGYGGLGKLVKERVHTQDPYGRKKVGQEGVSHAKDHEERKASLDF